VRSSSLQAKCNEYVFGAYTAVAWPQRPAAGSPNVTVADPSLRSLLFSLVNGEGAPFVVPLVDASRAICAHSTRGPLFGAPHREGQSDLYLMFKLRSADAARGCATNIPRAGSAYERPPGAPQWDMTTLAGREYFAAEQIDVYECNPIVKLEGGSDGTAASDGDAARASDAGSDTV
jgi:hypothetical protein